MHKKQIVGKTSNQFVYMASNRTIALDEYFVIKDKDNNNPIGKVIETYSYNDLPSMRDLSADIQNDIKDFAGKDIFLAKLKIEDELQKPIKSCAIVEKPSFDAVKRYLLKSNVNDGLVLGVIRGSESMYGDMPKELKDISPLLENGEIRNQDKVPFIFDILSFYQYPHLGLFGGSGSGKTYGFNVILEELIKKRIPSIIFDPHYEMNFEKNNESIDKKYNYNFNSNVESFQIGKDVGIPFSDISSMEFINLLQFAGNMTQPMISTLTSIHETGDSFILLKNRLEKLIELFELDEKRDLYENELSESDRKLYRKYKLKVSSLATLKALQWRILAIERENIFNGNIESVRRAILKRKTIIIRGTNKHLNMLASYMITKFYYSRRSYIDAKETNSENLPDIFPPFIICIDEAHIFAPKGDYSSPTKSILKTIAQEGRKYGIYEILATQRPGLLDDTIVAQLSNKIIFRTTISEDIEMISKETDLSKNEVKRLPYLSSGNAFLSSAIMGSTLSIRFRVNFTEGKLEVHPFDELDSLIGDDKIEEEILGLLPFNDISLEDQFNTLKSKGFNISIEDLVDKLTLMSMKGLVIKEQTPFGFYYKEK